MAHTFFYLQMAFRSPPDDEVRQRVREVILHAGERQNAQEKRTQYTHLRRVLGLAWPRLKRMTWDLVRTDEAKDAYEEWYTDLEDSSDFPDLSPNSAKPRQQHMVLTVILLAERDSNSDMHLGQCCDLDATHWRDAKTAQMLLESLESLSFASVHGDAIYLQPAPGQPGPTEAQLVTDWPELDAVE